MQVFLAVRDFIGIGKKNSPKITDEYGEFLGNHFLSSEYSLCLKCIAVQKVLGALIRYGNLICLNSLLF